ncbi:MAG: DUF421 domain-containing protein [Acutalibacteraceae bacterium]|nr:DUF421 domain-containing protein [Acutalibacteraceae bacterium]
MEILKVVLTSLLSVAALFAIAKIMGHKQMSQLDFFDYITGITIGSIAAELATELEKPWKPLVAMMIYGAVAVTLSILMSKCPKTRKYINGTPTVIMNNGKFYRKNMKKAKMDLSEFTVMCRQAGYFNLKDIQTAIFEYNGRLTILPVSTKRPANPLDFNIVPQPEFINTQVIADGKVLKANLKQLGLDEKWLKAELKAQGILNEKEVFLAVCDGNNQLTVFKAD